MVVHDAYDATLGADAATRLLAAWWGDTLAASVDDGLVHVAVSDDRVVGMAERGMLGDDPVVWKLYVSADRRSEGVGADLLRVAVAATEPGHDRVILEHLASNAAAARFYEREGFVVIRTEPSDDPANDLVWRARPLTAGRSAPSVGGDRSG